MSPIKINPTSAGRRNRIFRKKGKCTFGTAKKPYGEKTNQNSPDCLSKRICDLPQELYDKILDYTVSVDDVSEVEICRFYKPPVQLRIDMETRARVAANYYANTTFTCDEWTLDQCARMLGQWLRSLPVQHICMIRSVCIANSGKQVDTLLAAGSYVKAMLGQHRRWLREKLGNGKASEESENSCKITVLVGRRRKSGQTGYDTGRYDMTWTLLPAEKEALSRVLHRGPEDVL